MRALSFSSTNKELVLLKIHYTFSLNIKKVQQCDKSKYGYNELPSSNNRTLSYHCLHNSHK